MVSREAPVNPHSLIRRLLRASPVIISVSLITFLLGQFGLLSRYETTVLDTWLKLKMPRDVEELVVVEIPDEDYAAIFHQTSPLDPGALHELIDCIAKGRPALIAVDIDTSAPAYAGFAIPAGWPTIVWASDAVQQSGSRSLLPLPVLGRPHGEEGSALSGLSLLPQDSDGVFRRYLPAFPGGRENEFLSSFPRAVAKAYAGERMREDGEEEEVILNFSGDRYSFRRIQASLVRQLSSAPGWSSQSPIRGKICLLGGTYRAARDEYPTPLGPMAGVHLMAQAIATDLRGGGIRHANEWLMVFLEVLGGYLLVLIHHRFSLRAAVIISLIGIPFIALTACYLAFSSFGLWANAVPIFVAVLIHQLYEHANEYRKMAAEALKNNAAAPPADESETVEEAEPGERLVEPPTEPVI